VNRQIKVGDSQYGIIGDPFTGLMKKPNFGQKIALKSLNMQDFTSKHPLFEKLHLWKLDTEQTNWPHKSKYVDSFHSRSKFAIDSVHVQCK